MTVLPLLAAGAVVVGRWWFRPRLGRLVPAGGHRRSAIDAVGRIGRRVARRPLDPELDRRLGWALVATVAGMVVAPGGFLAGPVVWVAGWWRVRRRLAAQRRRRDDDLPDVLDLLEVALAAGVGLRAAIGAVGRHGQGPLATELSRVAAANANGRPLGEALAAFGDDRHRAEASLRSALVEADHLGTPLAELVHRIGHDARERRRRRREEEARRASVRLTLPLVLCLLPAFVLLAVFPLLLASFTAVAP